MSRTEAADTGATRRARVGVVAVGVELPAFTRLRARTNRGRRSQRTRGIGPLPPYASVPELGRVLGWFASHDARLVAAADPGFDTGEEDGRLILQTLIEIARWERQRLSERTRNGMRAAPPTGPASVAQFPELNQRIQVMRAEGMTLQAIADRLNAERIPTVRGGTKWRPSSVQTATGHQRPAR